MGQMTEMSQRKKQMCRKRFCIDFTYFDAKFVTFKLLKTNEAQTLKIIMNDDSRNNNLMSDFEVDDEVQLPDLSKESVDNKRPGPSRRDPRR